MNISKISLIGMPSAGKSTIAAKLAQKLNYRLMDLDRMTEEKEGQSLISILESKGSVYFLDIQHTFLEKIKPEEKVVISTGGSIIYHQKAIQWLKENTTVVFLNTPLEVIKSRLAQKPKAVVGLEEKGLIKLWKERMPIYTKHANVMINTTDKEITVIINEIISKSLAYY